MKQFTILVLSFVAIQLSAQDLYDLTTIQKIEITFEQSNWDALLDAEKAGDENYIIAQSVAINGEVCRLPSSSIATVVINTASTLGSSTGASVIETCRRPSDWPSTSILSTSLHPITSIEIINSTASLLVIWIVQSIVLYSWFIQLITIKKYFLIYSRMLFRGKHLCVYKFTMINTWWGKS